MIKTETKKGFDKLLESGKTAQGGEIIFVAEKIKNIVFPVKFDSLPKINVTLSNQSNAVPFKTLESLIGFQIKFLVNYTGSVTWTAILTQ